MLQKNSYLFNVYCKLSNYAQQKKSRIIIKENTTTNHQLEMSIVRKFANKATILCYIQNKTITSTGYKPISNKKELVEPQ